MIEHYMVSGSWHRTESLQSTFQSLNSGKRFRIASGLKDKSDEERISTLIYSLRDQAEDLLQSLKMSAADAAKYDNVLERFQNHFDKIKNTVAPSSTAACSKREKQ